MGIFMFVVVPLMVSLMPIAMPIVYIGEFFEKVSNYFANLL